MYRGFVHERSCLMQVWKDMMQQYGKNAINCKIGGQIKEQMGQTRFGGHPDVPKDFIWPTYETETFFDKTMKKRPLSFLAQFRCADLVQYDTASLLPKTGILSFFYETLSMEWGYAPNEKGCSCVYWFSEQDLEQAQFPKDLEQCCQFPALAIQFENEINFPVIEDLYLKTDMQYISWDEYVLYCEKMGNVSQNQNQVSKLLGWADVIQNNMTTACTLVTKGYDVGCGYKDIPKAEIQKANETSLDQWQLLFQLDTVTDDAFELMFGDCGRIYYYIKTEDLKQKRFENHWLILQCY